MKFDRICTIVLDSVGIGQQHDSEKYGDFGVNTLGNISNSVGLDLPNLKKMGLGNINYIKTVNPVSEPQSNYTKMIEISDGKDTLTGHWEMMGVTLENGFKQYIENGFDEQLISEFSRLTNRGVLANKQANGMAVIDEFYDEHIKTGKFIVYTSVDSTFQIAAHEDVISIDELYKACEIARELTNNKKYNVARVIARPFIGDKKNVIRTSNRHDYAILPPTKTVMEKLVESNFDSIAVGKISDIFSGVGVSKSIKTKSNMHGVDETIKLLKSNEFKSGHLFTNLVEFDSSFGHPRDVIGYKNCLEQFDSRVEQIIEAIGMKDLLIITADHGNDPTYKGNDHTREHVPLIVYSPSLQLNNQLNIRNSFQDIGETICQNFNLESTTDGTSFLDELI